MDPAFPTAIAIQDRSIRSLWREKFQWHEKSPMAGNQILRRLAPTKLSCLATSKRILCGPRKKIRGIPRSLALHGFTPRGTSSVSSLLLLPLLLHSQNPFCFAFSGRALLQPELSRAERLESKCRRRRQ